MTAETSWSSRLRSFTLTLLAMLTAIVVGGYAFTDLPERWGLRQTEVTNGKDDDHDHDAHAGHDDHGHNHGVEPTSDSIEVSRQARKNLRLRTQTVAVRRYTRYIEVPGLVTKWPGQTHVAVTSPLTGVINAIHVSRGELIKSGTPLFTLRLTHQDLVKTQETFLASLGEKDVAEREIGRLTSVTSSGAIAGKTLINRQYELDKLKASMGAARQAMLLHGLSEDEIAQIEKTRELVREVVVYAPMIHADRSLHHQSHELSKHRAAIEPSARIASMQPPAIHVHEHVDTDFLVTDLDVHRGQSVIAGQQIAQLSDYSRLLIEGQAYQRDAEVLRVAADTGADLQATLESTGDERETINGLKVVYIGNEVGRESRSLPFYVGLENKIERSEQVGTKRYVSWRYKPGQRLTVRLPVSQIDDAIVVPKDAVAEQGAERFLFVENGDRFERVSVVMLARDSENIAIANDGQVWPGQKIAITSAHQLQMELKNKSGGGIDPHAGHTH